MKANWIRSRQTQYTAYATFYLLIVIGAVALANYLANRYNKPFDFTTDKKFSLSDQTIKAINNLKQDVRITYFDQASRFAGAKDLLDRYDSLSPKVKVDYVDPDRKPEVARAMAVKNLGTIYIETAGRRQEARSLSEEEVTGAMIRALKNNVRTVCSVTGSGEPGLDENTRDGLSTAKSLMQADNFQVRGISLLDQAEVPKDCTVLMIAGPKFDYVEPAVQAVKRYVEGGGRALLMLDSPVKVGKDQSAENAKLVELLASWGVTANKDLIIDASGVGTLYGFSAAVPLASRYGQHQIVREMGRATTAFPLARSIEVKSADKSQVEQLVSTSPNSFGVMNVPEGGEIEFKEGRDKQGPLQVAAAGTYGTGDAKTQGRFVFIGSSGWIANSIVNFNGNRDLFLNMLNWLSSDEDLISIRPKDPADRRLQMNTSQMRVVFYTTMILMPLMLVAGGVGVWWKRR